MNTWILVLIYTSGSHGLQVEQIRGIANESTCKVAATALTKEWETGRDDNRAFCLQEGRQTSIEDLVKSLKIEKST